MDRTLGLLGVRFYRAVLWNGIERASELREAIESYAVDRKREEWERERIPAERAEPRATDSRPVGKAA